MTKQDANEALVKIRKTKKEPTQSKETDEHAKQST